MEEWKKIKNWPYEVSSFGRVRSIDRYVAAKLKTGSKPFRKKRMLKSKILKLSITHKGYQRVILSLKTKIKAMAVHRLVLEAFLPNSKCKGLQVNHKNFNKIDNNIDNLEWVTAKQNTRHSMNNQGTHVGEGHGGAKISEAVAVLIFESKERRSVLAAKYGITVSNISKIKRGINWSHATTKKGE